MRMISKKCNDCKEVKDLSSFGSNKAIKGGKNRICKICSRVRAKDYRSRNKEKVAAKNKVRCKEYYAVNRDAILAEQKEHRQQNPDHYKKKSRKYYSKNKEARKAYRKQYYKDNVEKELTRNREYAKNNRGVCNAVKVKYYTSKNSATPKWADLDKIKVLYEKAQWLGELTGLKYHVDHIVPLQGEQVCGLHVWENLQILEGSLNCSKRNSFDLLRDTKQDAEDDI